MNQKDFVFKYTNSLKVRLMNRIENQNQSPSNMIFYKYSYVFMCG